MVRRRQIRLAVMVLLISCIPLFMFAFYSYKNISDQTYERSINDRSLYLLQNVNLVERLLNSISAAAESFLQSSSTQEAMFKSMEGNEYQLYFNLRKELLNLYPFDANNADSCLINYKEKWFINNAGLYRFSTVDDCGQYNRYFFNKCISGWQVFLTAEESNNTAGYDSFFSHDAIHLVKTIPYGKQTNLTGVLIVKTPLTYLWQLFQQETNGFAIFDTSGCLIFSDADDNTVLQFRNFIARRDMQRTTNVRLYKENQGDILYTISEYNGWTYLLNASDIRYHSGYTVILPTIIGICMIIVAFSALGAALLSKKVYQPVEGIIEALHSENYSKNTDPFSYIEYGIDALWNKNQIAINKIREQEPSMREYISSAVLQGNMNPAIINKYSYLFPEMPEDGKMFVAVFELNSAFLCNELHSYDVSMKSVSNAVKNFFQHEYVLSPVILNKKLCVIFHVNEDSNYISYAESVIQLLNSSMPLPDGMAIKAAIGKSFYNILDAIVSYQEALDACSYAIFYPQKNILPYEELSINYDFYLQQNKRVQEKILNAMRTADKEKAESSLDELFALVFQKGSVSSEWKVILINLLTELIILRQEQEPGFAAKNENDMSLYDELFDIESQDDMKLWLWHRMILPYIKTANKINNTKQMKLVKQMKEMIENAYMQDLTIEAVASELNYSPAYLRRIFTDICGKSFSVALTTRKMEVALKWLSETDMMVQEIAERLGYSNSQNFIRYFKAFTGETPGKYRQKNEKTRDAE